MCRRILCSNLVPNKAVPDCCRRMPLSPCLTVVDGLHVLRPEPVTLFGKVRIAGAAIRIQAIAEPIDHFHAVTVIGSWKVNSFFVIKNFVLPTAMANCRRLLPIHEGAFPWIKSL